ncbi:Cytochrome P450 [Mycena sanguinolenta]|uniref:Cytochrome P450 n=1 Tax=Mycena sanguinolenta TaxID=230812 RepID=A0A8H6Z5Z9_9AGAR|nr:Cytochrome P450 [Mycena sanguinolenta]
MPKGPLWDGRLISRSDRKSSAAKEAARGDLINTRDLNVHAKSRKTWDTAFIPAAIKGYKAMLIRRVAQLVEALGSQTDATVDLSQCFDFMGDLAFGGGFELMRDGDSDGLWHMMERGLYLPALTQQVPWCLGFLPYFSMAGKKESDALRKFALDQAKRRLQEGSIHNDLFYYLMDAKRLDAKPQPLPLVISNATLAIVAGSDTSATVLSNTFFFLLSHPESYDRLQSEIDEAFPPGDKDPTDTALLSNLPYLTAVIKESLRLLPPVATSLQRAPTVGTGISSFLKVPPSSFRLTQSIAIHGTFLRALTSTSPTDGWQKITTPEFVTNDDAFIPFSTGPANCVGKNLAMLEIRMVVAHIMRAFELQFSDGYDTQRWEEDLKDYFVMQKGSLPVNLTRRTG